MKQCPTRPHLPVSPLIRKSRPKQVVSINADLKKIIQVVPFSASMRDSSV